MKLNVLDYYRNMQDTRTILIYCGPVWRFSVEELGETLLKRLELENLSVSFSHSIFSVFIELMNNISLYSAEKDIFMKNGVETPAVARGVFILGAKDDKYFLQCGNAIKSSSRAMIQERLDHLNKLDKQGLRRFYREKLTGENNNPESKGAGLGFIEIAKRAGSEIKYEFKPMTNELSFFTMLVEMRGEKQ